jgi:hypothetical protein
MPQPRHIVQSAGGHKMSERPSTGRPRAVEGRSTMTNVDSYLQLSSRSGR